MYSIVDSEADLRNDVTIRRISVKFLVQDIRIVNSLSVSALMHIQACA